MGGGRVTAPVDFAALPPTLVVPGLASWLGRETAPDDTDFHASLDGGFTESFEDYCDRISRAEAP
jgi:hypothetical protein